MKKTETIQHEPTEVIITYCDRCQKIADEANRPVNRPPYVCVNCRRDLCRSCAMSDPRDFGDYPPKYCHQCWATGEPFRKRQEELEQEAENEMVKWTRECVNLRQNEKTV